MTPLVCSSDVDILCKGLSNCCFRSLRIAAACPRRAFAFGETQCVFLLDRGILSLLKQGAKIEATVGYCWAGAYGFYLRLLPAIEEANLEEAVSQTQNRKIALTHNPARRWLELLDAEGTVEGKIALVNAISTSAGLLGSQLKAKILPRR